MLKIKKNSKVKNKKPNVIIVNTVKGKGIPFLKISLNLITKY